MKDTVECLQMSYCSVGWRAVNGWCD